MQALIPPVAFIKSVYWYWLTPTLITKVGKVTNPVGKIMLAL